MRSSTRVLASRRSAPLRVPNQLAWYVVQCQWQWQSQIAGHYRTTTAIVECSPFDPEDRFLMRPYRSAVDPEQVPWIPASPRLAQDRGDTVSMGPKVPPKPQCEYCTRTVPNSRPHSHPRKPRALRRPTSKRRRPHSQ